MTMNLRKLRRIARERTGRGATVSYRVRCERWKSNYEVFDIWRRMWVTTGNFWRIGTKTNFQ